MSREDNSRRVDRTGIYAFDEVGRLIETPIEKPPNGQFSVWEIEDHFLVFQRTAQRVQEAIRQGNVPKAVEQQAQQDAADVLDILDEAYRMYPSHDTAMVYREHLEDFAALTCQLGMTFQRLMCRLGELDVMRGIADREARKKGGKSKNANAVVKQNNYQTLVDGYMKSGLSYNHATKRVAEDTNAGQSTVKRHTTNPNPQNRGRQKR